LRYCNICILSSLADILIKREWGKLLPRTSLVCSNYASVVWLNELTAYKIIRTLESIHYKGLRIAAKDYYTLLSKSRLDDIFNRATPCKWMKYSNAKMALNFLSQGEEGPPISACLREKLYVNDRNPNKISLHDTSRLKIGRHSFLNRLKCLKEINFDWRITTPDTLQINLKKTYFTMEGSHQNRN